MELNLASDYDESLKHNEGLMELPLTSHFPFMLWQLRKCSSLHIKWRLIDGYLLHPI